MANSNSWSDSANIGYYNGQEYRDKNKWLQAAGYQKPGGGGDIKPYLGYAPGSYEEQVAQSIEMAKRANEPAINSLRSSIPEVQKKYEQLRGQLQAEEVPLKERYSQLIGEFKGNQQTAENRQVKTTNAELARRGISGGSLYDQTLTDAVNPVTQQYTGLLRDTSMAGDKAIRELVNTIASSYTQESADERDILNAIAQLQSGAAMSGIQMGNQRYQTDLDNQFRTQQAAQEEALRRAAQALAERQFTEVTKPQSDIEIRNILSQIEKRNSSAPTLLELLNGVGGSNRPPLSSFG